MNAKIRAHRVLRKLNKYEAFDEQKTPYEMRKAIVERDEIIGMYKNSQDNIYANIIITKLGIYFFNREWQFVPYQEIDSTVSPVEVAEANHLQLRLKNRGIIAIPILGRDGKFKDLFSVMRFIDRVVHDLKI